MERNLLSVVANLARSLRGYVTVHGGWPRGFFSVISRGIEVVESHGLKGALEVAVTFKKRREELELDATRTPASLPKGKLPRLEPLGPAPRSGPVDVVVCVHNAFEHVVACLESVTTHTVDPYRLIIVDDGSGEPTSTYLQRFASISDNRILIRNEAPLGYTRAANLALRCTTAPYVVLLNSDTLVTPLWLERLVACAESDPNIGLVGPLSNTASWQSIPEVESKGDWATNTFDPGVTPELMAEWVAQWSAQAYPRVAFLNGFCLLLKREVLKTVGVFDEGRFGEGYGEENDLCLRAGAAGWHLSIADDAFVYHAQSMSYRTERRKQLSALAAQKLEEKHSREIVARGVARTKNNRILAGVRARSRYFKERDELIRIGSSRWKGRSVAFVLPVKFIGGGPKVVLQEARAMYKMGVEVILLNLEPNRLAFEASVPSPGIPVLYLDEEREVARIAGDFDAVVATVWPSVYWLPQHRKPGTALGYYVQDFEPLFHPHGSRDHQRALGSYSHLDGKLFTKTKWNRNAVKTATGRECEVVGPSVDVDLYRPRLQGAMFGARTEIVVAAMVRPATPRRNAPLTAKVLKRLHRKYGSAIHVVIFGTNESDPSLNELELDFPHTNLGVQTSEGIAHLFNETDIFLDASKFQAMGLTAMEAMACGAAALVPRLGGTVELAHTGGEPNALAVDTTSIDAVTEAASRLIEEPVLRTSLARSAINSMPQFHPESAAFRILESLFA